MELEFETKELVVTSGFTPVIYSRVFWEIDHFNLFGSHGFIVTIPADEDVPQTRYEVRLEKCDTILTLRYYEEIGRSLNCTLGQFYHIVRAHFIGSHGEKIWKSLQSRMSDFKTDYVTPAERVSEIFSIHELPPEVKFHIAGGTIALEIRIEIYRKKANEYEEGDKLIPRATTSSSNKDQREYRFQEFLKSDHLSDVKVISSEGQEFPAHKVVLMVASPVFGAMFRTGMTESETGVVKVEDLSSADVNFLLHFIYTQEILSFIVDGKVVENDTDSDNTCEEKKAIVRSGDDLISVEEVLYMAEKYDLENLKSFVDLTFRRLCDEKNAIYLFSVSKKYSLKCSKMIMAFIKKHTSLLDELLSKDFKI